MGKKAKNGVFCAARAATEAALRTLGSLGEIEAGARRGQPHSGQASFGDAVCGFAVQAHAVSLDEPNITNRAIGNVESRAALQTRHDAGLDRSIVGRDEE